MSLTKKLMSNALYLSLDFVLVTVASTFFWLIVGKFLLPSDYGIVSTVNAIVPILSLVSMLGISTAVQKLIPEYLTLRNGKSNSLIKFAIFATLASNLVIAIIFLLLSNPITNFLKIPIEAVFLTILGIVSMSLYQITGAVVYGFQNMKKYFVSDSVGYILKLFITILLFYLGWNYLGPLLALSIGFFASVFLRLDFKWFTTSKFHIDKKQILFGYSLPALIASLSTTVFTYYQYLILPILQNQTIAGAFAVAMRITFLISVLPFVLTNALFPIVSQLSTSNKNKNVQAFYVNEIFRYACLILIPITIFAIFFSNFLILIFSRPEYLSSSNFFPFLAVGSAIYGLGNIFLYILYAIRQPTTYRNISIISSLTFLILSIILSYFYSSYGLSIAFLISSLVIFLASFIGLKKFIPITFGNYMLKLFLASIVLIAFLFVPTLFGFDTLIRFLIFCIGAIFYFIILLKLKFFQKRDLKIFSYVSSKSPLFKKQIKYIIDFLSNRISE